jgi:hypothetical protein
VDVSNAFRAGPGAYDSIAIRWAYTQFSSPAEERAGLAAITSEAISRGLQFLTDSDAGAGVNPDVTRWLNNSDAVAELERQTAVRAVLLSKFNESVIARGDPMSLLSERLVPVYLHHRYAIEAAIKAVGGMEYSFAMRGDNQVPTKIIEPARQRRAIDALLATMTPKALAIPLDIVKKLPPGAYGISEGWTFDSPAGIVFDPLAVARSLASYVADGLFAPDRVERMIAFHAQNAAAPSADEVINTVVQTVYGNTPVANTYEAALRRASRRAVVDALLSLASSTRATADARAAAEYHLNRLATRLATVTTDNAEDRAANATVVRDARNWLDRRIVTPRSTGVIALPPGTPIGN